MTLFERCVITLMCALFRVLVYQNSHVSVFSQSRVCLVLIISESGKPSLVAAQRALARERYTHIVMESVFSTESFSFSAVNNSAT